MNSKTTQELMASCQGLVRSLAWKIHCKLPKHVDLEDLVSYGQVGLAEAARDYEEGRGHFTTFAYYRVRGAILDGLSKMHWFNQADYHRGKYEHLAGEVLNAESEETEQPSPDVATDARWLKGVSGALVTVYVFCQGEDESGAAGSVEDTATIAPPAALLKREVHQKLRELVDALPKDAGSLIRAAYFEGLSLKEAGERIGISKAWASRLHAKTLGLLARSLEELQLAD